MKIKKITHEKLNEDADVFCVSTDGDRMFTFRPKAGNASLASFNCNFGFIYGGSHFSYQKVQLVKNKIKLSEKDAKDARDAFMKLYRDIALHIKQTKTEFESAPPQFVTQHDSYGNPFKQRVPYKKEITTLLGRRIAVETANTALNYPVQGSGGDVIKLAACLFEDMCKERNLDAYIINYIHDDVVIEGLISQKPEIKKAFTEAMNTAANCLMGKYFSTDISEEVLDLTETPVGV